MAGIMIAMMAAMSLPQHVTTADNQDLPCAGTAAGVWILNISVIEMPTIVGTALMNQTLGQIAHIAKKRAACPAQVYLATVQSFVTVGLLVQMLGTNYSLHAILKKSLKVPAMLSPN
jgi:predicted hotdog family 3-hydroxylacyl-ACP dehydratase